MSKKNIILSVVLACLVIVSFIFKTPLTESERTIDVDSNFLSTINTDEINKIEITNSGVTTVLENIEGRWRIEGTKDFWVKDDLTQQIRDAQSTKFEMVSKNKDKKDDFQTDDSGTLIVLKSSDKVLNDFVLGKMANDYMSSYIAKSNSDETYSVKLPGFNSIFAKSDWYDKTIFSSAIEDANYIRFQYGKKQIVIKKNEDIWKGVEPYNFGVSEDKIDEILKIMTSLQASDIPEQTFQGTGLEKNELIVQIKGENELDNILMIGSLKDKVEGFYFAKKGSSDNIYLITQIQKNILTTTTRKLR